MSPARIMTPRGMRTFTRAIALPRETQAAARAITAAKAKAPQLAKIATEEGVNEVLDDSFAEAMQNMAIQRDPHVSMFGVGYVALDDSGVTVPLPFNFFNTQVVGAAASGIWGVWHNLLDDRQPLKPCLIHNIGISMFAVDTLNQLSLLEAMTGRITLQRGKEDLFEFPLAHALVSMMGVDAAAAVGTAPAVHEISPLSSGGLELEGHGAPFLMNEAIGLRADWPMGANFADQETGISGRLILIARVDGEVMEV